MLPFHLGLDVHPRHTRDRPINHRLVQLSKDIVQNSTNISDLPSL
mgnify:CR=1 FL=1